VYFLERYWEYWPPPLNGSIYESGQFGILLVNNPHYHVRGLLGANDLASTSLAMTVLVFSCKQYIHEYLALAPPSRLYKAFIAFILVDRCH